MNHSDLIDKFGGTSTVAKILGIKPPSVHAWRASGIPDDKLIRLAPIAEQMNIATRKQLFPKDYAAIWPELAKKKAA